MSKEKKNTKINTVVGLANAEKVDRYGSAGAEYLKGLRGIDNETGKVYDRSLLDVSNYKIDSANPENSINQQAGFSAEIAKVSRDNAKNIIDGSKVRVSRTEDIDSFGKNHPVADHVEIIDGVVDASSISQMKYLNDTEGFLTKVACGDGGGKSDLSRYMENKSIDLPTEQVDLAKDFCDKKAISLRQQADAVEAKGKLELAGKMRNDADKFERLKDKIRDGGLTRDDARSYRINPEWETAKDIANNSHNAAIEGAKIAAVISATVSLVMNGIAVYSGEKEFDDAAVDVIKSTGVTATVGYVGTFSGAAIKGYMQQSESTIAKAVSKTAIPALAVTTCFALAGSITAYAAGSLNENELMMQMGSSVSKTLASSMGSAVGQIVVPIPVLGALVGGMVGGAVSGLFYQALVSSSKRADIAQNRYLEIKRNCEVARAQSEAYCKHIEIIISQKMFQLEEAQQHLMLIIDGFNDSGNADAFAKGINDFAIVIGKKLEFECKNEFDVFMRDDLKALVL